MITATIIRNFRSLIATARTAPGAVVTLRDASKYATCIHERAASRGPARAEGRVLFKLGKGATYVLSQKVATLSVGGHVELKQHFSTTRRLQDKKEEDEEKKGGEEPNMKRLPSDDPDQLPAQFFTAKGYQNQALRQKSFWQRVNIWLAMPVLKRLSNGFDENEFLEGAKAAVNIIMEIYTKNTVEGLEGLMTERMILGFSETLEEYKKHNVLPDYDFRPISGAQIMGIRIFQKEELREVEIDVQVVDEERFSLRDSTGRAVGNEGEWIIKATTWTFKSPLPNLSWVISDLP